jgi:malate permease and related proteins
MVIGWLRPHHHHLFAALPPLNAILTVFWQNILPIFLVAGSGYALQRWQVIDRRSLARATLYIFSPALVFSSLVKTRLPGDELLDLTLFTLLNMAVMALLALLTGRLLHMSRRSLVTLVLVTVFVNSGNYGLVMVQLRYGDAGLARAIVYYTTGTVLLYSVGIMLASMGALPWRQAVAQMLRLPPMYAALAAIVVYATHLEPPLPLMKAIDLAGQGAIPVMLLVLGMQFEGFRGGMDWRLIAPALGLRLVIAPVVAVWLAGVVGLTGLGFSASIIEAIMPTAVITIILATEFDLPVATVTSIVILSTVLSPLTIATTVVLLGL